MEDFLYEIRETYPVYRFSVPVHGGLKFFFRSITCRTFRFDLSLHLHSPYIHWFKQFNEIGRFCWNHQNQFLKLTTWEAVRYLIVCLHLSAQLSSRFTCYRRVLSGNWRRIRRLRARQVIQGRAQLVHIHSQSYVPRELEI